MKKSKILIAAQAAPAKGGLEEHQEAICLLRDKGYSWRDIASFLSERGVATDHTKVYRFFQRLKKKEKHMNIPNASQYSEALSALDLSDTQKAMLRAHYNAPNRTVTYGQLAEAAGYDDHQVANSQYGKLGHVLGDTLNLTFSESAARPGELFYSSALGMPNAYGKADFELVMHHELAKALESLGWFD